MICIIILIVFSVILIGFSVNYLIYRKIVADALRKFINPYLESQELKLKEFKFTGLFNNGDFSYEGVSPIFIPEMGKFITSTYVYVFALSRTGQVIRFTVKIHCRFLFIQEVFLRTGENKDDEIELPYIKI